MRVAVVGTAAYLSGMGLGEFIDSHDSVIRINTGYSIARIAPQDYGTRTDVCYVTPNCYKDKMKPDFPSGAEIILKRHVRPEWTLQGKKKELSNTGIMCLVDYAVNGHQVFFTGCDFYSALTGGIIGPAVYGNKHAYPKERHGDIYGPGYNNAKWHKVDRVGVAFHRGGLEDFKILVRLIHNGYPITVDSHLQDVIDRNMYQINLNEL